MVNWGRGASTVLGEILRQGDVLPEGVGVGEDAAVQFLAHDVVEAAFGEGQVEFAGEPRAVEGGGDGATDRGELGVVADKNDAAARRLRAEFEEVGEEVAVMGRLLRRQIGEDRCRVRSWTPRPR